MDRLLEREGELQALTAAVEAAHDGCGTVVLVRGEAGIGKTSLLRALRERTGVPFHIGRCEPLSVPEPLGPLRELAAGVGVVNLEELGAGDRRVLARALQRRLTSHGPAVAGIEDLHWADPATLDVLRILARRAEDAPLALVVTLRDDELGANPPLAVLVGDLARDAAVTRVVLQPLSPRRGARARSRVGRGRGRGRAGNGRQSVPGRRGRSVRREAPDVGPGRDRRAGGPVGSRRGVSSTWPPSLASVWPPTCSTSWRPVTRLRLRRHWHTVCSPTMV